MCKEVPALLNKQLLLAGKSLWYFSVVFPQHHTLMGRDRPFWSPGTVWKWLWYVCVCCDLSVPMHVIYSSMGDSIRKLCSSI